MITAVLGVKDVSYVGPRRWGEVLKRKVLA